MKSMINSDERIKTHISTHLCWDDCLQTSAINVAVQNGHVTLTGKVPSLRVRDLAEKDARAIAGVVGVTNKLSVEPSMQPQDSEIGQAIKSMLEWTVDIDASKISIMVHSGVVTLNGAVDAYWEKLRAESIASDANGVVDVINNLDVVPPLKKGDRDIEAEIAEAFERSSATGMAGLKIRSNNGHVTLSGTAPTWDMYEEADEVARHTSGVTGITNRIRVE